MMCDEIDGDFKIMKHLKGGLRLLNENYLAKSWGYISFKQLETFTSWLKRIH